MPGGFTRRQFVHLGAGIAAVGALAACGRSDKVQTTSTAPASTSAPPSAAQSSATPVNKAMVTVPKLTGIAWTDRVAEGVRMYADDSHRDAYCEGADQASAEAQAQVLQDLIDARVAALLVTPFQPDAVERLLAQAMEAGIVVVTHEAPNITNAHYDVEPFHNAEYGIHLMRELASRMNYAGEYIQLVGSLNSVTHKAWVDAANEYQRAHYPEMIRVNEPIETADNAERAYETVRELLSVFPNLAGIQGSASTDVVGAGRAVEEAGLSDGVVVGGTSTPKNARPWLENGAVDFIQFWDPAMTAYAQNVVAQILLDHGKIRPGISLVANGYGKVTLAGKVIFGDNAWITVTKDNADAYDF